MKDLLMLVILAASAYPQTRIDWSQVKNLPPNLVQACPDGMGWVRSNGQWICSLIGGGGGSLTWGAITGQVSDNAALSAALNAKLSSVSWGIILGTLSAQVDLWNALQAKQSTAAPGSNGQLIVNSGGSYGARNLINSDLPTSPVVPGSCGDTTHSCGLSANQQGIITSLVNNSISSSTLPGQVGTDFQLSVITSVGGVANDTVNLAIGNYLLGTSNLKQTNSCQFKMTAGNTPGYIDIWMTNGGIVQGQWSNGGTNALTVTGVNCSQSGAGTPAFPQCDGSHQIGQVNITSGGAFDPAAITQNATLQLPCQMVTSTGLANSVVGNTQTIGPGTQILRLDQSNSAVSGMAMNLSLATSFGPYPTVTFAALSGKTVVGGQQFYCSDCTVTSSADDTCATGGTGAEATGLNGAWHCGGQNQNYAGSLLDAYCAGNMGTAAATNYFLTPGALVSPSCTQTSAVGNPLPRACRAKNLTLVAATAPTTTLTGILFRNGVATTLTCTTALSGTSCNSGAAFVDLAALDAWSIAVQAASANDSSTNVRVGFICQ